MLRKYLCWFWCIDHLPLMMTTMWPIVGSSCKCCYFQYCFSHFYFSLQALCWLCGVQGAQGPWAQWGCHPDHRDRGEDEQHPWADQEGGDQEAACLHHQLPTHPGHHLHQAGQVGRGLLSGRELSQHTAPHSLTGTERVINWICSSQHNNCFRKSLQALWPQ